MPRTVNTAVREVRREAFLDAAQRLIQSKGYEQMTVQDVLDELEASRGAFYHYFDSKVSLLEAVVDRLVVAGTDAVAPVVDDQKLGAVDKMARLFSGIAGWKAERRELMLAIARVWYSDENALVREKLHQATLTRLAPLLAAIIRQGTDEGVFTVAFPDDSARVLVWLIRGAQELASRLLMAREANEIPFEVVESSFTAYFEAFDRILGLPVGTLKLVDPDNLRLWFG